MDDAVAVTPGDRKSGVDHGWVGLSDAEAERQRLRVKLSAFEGPLDLLLHLVRVNELDITEIPVVEIARQYDDHLEMMRDLDLDVAGEFLVMAATLAYLKSRTLLPQPVTEEPEEDARGELTRQLLEHERFLLAAESLGARGDVQWSLWTRPAGQHADLDGEVALDASLVDLVRTFRSLLESVGDGAGMNLGPDGISVEERMGQILSALDATGMVGFESLFPRGAAKLDQIVTFLALLELLRLQQIAAWQGKRFAGIRITRKVAPTGDGAVDGVVEPPSEG